MIPVLSFVDDGHGMSHVDVVRMLSFGHKQPDGDDPDHIGRFGIGFKVLNLLVFHFITSCGYFGLFGSYPIGFTDL